MQFIPSGTPNNNDTLGVLGYLIVVNRQVHSYQVEALTEYLDMLHLNIKETVLADIIDGKDESVTFTTSLSAFEEESEDIQKDIYYMLVILSFVDNSIDDNETSLISQMIKSSHINSEDAQVIKQSAMDDAESIRSSQNVLFERPQNQPKEVKQNIFWRIIHWIKNFFNKLFCAEQGIAETDNNVDYKSMIDRCAVVALEDFQVALPAYSAVISNGQSCIDELNKYKMSLSLETGLSAEVANIVKIFVEALNENVLKQSKLTEASLVQKKRTIPDFTISLIGRTKAGKSTLHAILTNQGRDKIGTGKQRTTRYNRVYQWNLLRLIDTPGIGSAEADGRSDDEIAESVLGESDVICFVIVDDSILKDVLEFIEKVATLNKPVIILLNHKENIANDVKFKRFINKPSDWLTSEGESRLAGHINRIRKYAQDHDFGGLVRIFPVFLLAAQMAGDEKYYEYRDLLWENSNIDTFIEQLKVWISSAGKIKRSQTILDEAIHIFEKSKEQIVAAQKPVREQVERLAQQRSDKINALKTAKELTINNVRVVLQEQFDNLARNEALVFAEEVYGRKDDISEMWESYLAKIEFERDVKYAVEAELNYYSHKANDTITDLFEDFYYSINTSFEVANISIPMQLDFKSISRLTGSVLGVVGSIVTLILGASNPVGWIITGAGILVGLGSFLFSSKEKKRQKAINKVYQTIRDSILGQAPEQIEQTVSDIDCELNKSIERINNLFTNLISGLQETIRMSDKLMLGYEEQIKVINKVYAWRIIQFLLQKDDAYTLESVNQEIKNVDRSVKRTITIESKHKHVDAGALDGIIADKVIII